MKSQTFQHEMTQTSSVFGRKSDLKVVFKGDGAATNGETVYLPAIAHDKEVDAETQMVMRGYVDHEAGHNRHSDMPLIMKTYEQWHKEGKPVLKGLHNAIEDIWVEKRVMREYVGSEKNLSAVSSSCNKMFHEQHKTSGDPMLQNWGAVGPLAITWEGRRNYEGIEGVDECMNLIPGDLQDRVKEWVSRIEGCKTTADCIELAEEVYGEIKANGKKPKPTQPDDEDGQCEAEQEGDDETKTDGGQGDDQGTRPDDDATEGDDPDGGDSSDGSDDPDGEEGQGTDQSEGDDEGSEPESGEAKGEDVAGEEPDDVQPFDAGLKAGLDVTLKQRELTTSDPDTYRPYTTEYDKVFHAKLPDDQEQDGSNPNKLLRTGNESLYKTDRTKLGDAVHVMSRKLSRAFMAKQDRQWDAGREAGRLDSRRLVAAVNGAVNVFKMREEASDVDTAVMIMTDMSGSMRGSKIVMARRVVVALCETLERTTVAYEVVGFGTNEGGIPYEEEKAGLGGGFDRTSPIRHYIFKAFEDSLHISRGAIGTMARHEMHHNVDGESVLWGHERLRRRPERRRIMLVLSDGSPEFVGCSHDKRMQHMRNAVAHITKEGTDMIGIGIQSSAVSRFYERHTVVMQLSDLSKGALDQLARLLIDDKFDVTSADLIKAQRLG